jgi:hypothetical protein
MIKRYNLNYFGQDAWINDNPEGDYVLYSDYIKLEDAFREIYAVAPTTGEDCSYLIAKRILYPPTEK